MTIYPDQIDSDVELPRVDDDLTNFSAEIINAIREAIFAIEKELGIAPSGSLNSLKNFLSVSFNDNGTIKNSALSAVGLVSLPITNFQIGDNAGIEEKKLKLDHFTNDLYTLFISNKNLLDSLVEFTNLINSDLLLHLAGSTYLSNGSTKARHTVDQIDLKSKLIAEDLSFRNAQNADEAFVQINNALVNHENSISKAHIAEAISVDTENFNEVPKTSNTVQKVLEFLDDTESNIIARHRSTQHVNSIPKIGRIEPIFNSIGKGINIVPETNVIAYLVTDPNLSPVDNISNGDDIIKFVPSNGNFEFDAKFSKVKSGDIITINYGNGLQTSFIIDSIRFSPGNEWITRIAGINLVDTSANETLATARIDRSNVDIDTFGILSTASANIRNSSGPIDTNIIGSLIVSDPKSASCLGLGFDSGKINSTHYKLYIEFYPTGNPLDKIIAFPFIDVSGNAGVTPGKYTLESVVQSTNDKLREFGYNLRLIAFQYNGEFGLSLADCINNASFAIISGTNSSGTLVTGKYTENIIGGNSLDDFDALGFGKERSNIASPTFQNAWTDSTAALLPTKIISPAKNRFFYVNGLKHDSFAKMYLTNDDGSWDGYISTRNAISNTNIEVTYTIALDLERTGLKPGKTIIIQPSILFSDPNYHDVDYGRFIIKNVTFIKPCGSLVTGETQITVVNGIHATGLSFGFSSSPKLPVKIFFSYDSISFDNQNIIDTGDGSTNYSRFYEVFINDFAKTFSHERCRLPRQTETASLLNTTNFHVLNVSPKLRGYRGSNPALFNKYIRFFVQNYNPTSGTFDGYVGQKNGNAVIKKGPTISCKKNIPTKFFDETENDFIELIFVDNNSSPGINIASNIYGRYVDIELFDSLQENPEIFYISSCEVNWSPNSQENIIQFITDRREFGSIGELNFTQSAKDFINAGNKYLHSNGILFGFEFDSVSSVLNSGEIFFKGGKAHINGKIVVSNNSSVVIPRIYENGNSLPQDVDWAICVNEFGNLIPVLITSTEQQYFATPDSGNYYVDSSTFQNLLFRRNLTPIMVITVTVGSLSVSSMTDVRKFIEEENSSSFLTWAGTDGKIIGHFYSFDALKYWINSSDNQNQHINVKGTFNISSPINLNGFTRKVIFNGENSLFNINAGIGFILGSNISLNNFTFNYFGTNSSYLNGAFINLESSHACLSGLTDTNLSDIEINNCIFNNSIDSRRPPFILLLMNKAQINKNIFISNNKFNDVGTNIVNQSQAAIVLMTMNGGAETNPALALNIRMAENICNQKQGIYLTTIAGVTGAESPGLNAVHCKIYRNLCGIIGILSSGVISTINDLTSIDAATGIEIFENTCSVIGNFYDTGDKIADVQKVFYGIGNINIQYNNTHWIFIQNLDISASNQYSSINISNNNLTAFDASYLSIFSPTLPNYAIYLIHYSTESSQTIISKNFINFGRYDGVTYSYLHGIHSDSSSIITDNIIKGLSLNAKGISATGGDGSSHKIYNISNNQIYRNSTNISSYIDITNASAKTFGICKNNFFDDKTIDNSSETLINGSFDQWIVKENINQSMIFRGSYAVGKWGSGFTTPFIFGDSTLLSETAFSGLAIYQAGGSDQETQIHYDTSIAGTVRKVFYSLELEDVIPRGAYVVSCSVSLQASVLFDTTASFTLSLIKTGGLASTGPTTITTSLTTITVITGDSTFILNDTVRPILKLTGTLNNSALGGNINLMDLTVKYRW